MKVLTKSTFIRKQTPPNVAIPHLLVYSNPVLVNFSGRKCVKFCQPMPKLSSEALMRHFFFFFKIPDLVHSRVQQGLGPRLSLNNPAHTPLGTWWHPDSTKCQGSLELEKTKPMNPAGSNNF